MPVLLYLGSLSLGACIPILLQISLAIDLVIPGLLLQLSVTLAGYSKLALRLGIKPPSLSGNLDLAVKIGAAMSASIGFSPPSIDFALTAVLALILKLELQIKGLQLAIDLALQIKGLLVNAGVHAFVYQGPLDSMGATLASGIPSNTGLAGSTTVYAPVFLANASADPATVAAMQLIFKSS